MQYVHLHEKVSHPQSTYRGRVEIEGVYRSLSWCAHYNFVRDVRYSERGWACTPPPPPAWANFSIVMKCTPGSGLCHSVCTLWSRLCSPPCCILNFLCSMISTVHIQYTYIRKYCYFFLKKYMYPLGNAFKGTVASE